MLDIRYIDNNIIEVKETLMSFNKDTISYFYYDISKWIRYNNRPCSKPMTSELIKSNPAPDNKYHDERSMTQSNIDWVKKMYIPKAENKK